MSVLTREQIRSLCTEQSFERGVTYYEQERVRSLTVDDEHVTATVLGTDDYSVSVALESDSIRTTCSCPYDYAGDCKHIVAVLLAVLEDDREGSDSTDTLETGPTGPPDIDTLLERTPPEELRAFLREALTADRELRDRFVAATGEETGKTVYDYKQEIGKRFHDASDRHGFIEYGTWVDFSQYHDLAETHREHDRIDEALAIYRALAETIHEHIDRVDDSSGHYGHELQFAIEQYVETLAAVELDHEAKRPHIEYLFWESLDPEFDFVAGHYEDALRSLCTTRADLEYWLDLFETHVLELPRESKRTPTTTTTTTTTTASPTADSECGRSDDVLSVSDFTDGPLTVEDFVGDALTVDHLAVGTLRFEYFVGDAFDELLVDEPTTVEKHTADESHTETAVDADRLGITIDVESSYHKRRLLETYMTLLEDLGKDDALDVVYEHVYLERSRFCNQYAQRLLERGEDERALAVIEDGIDTFRSPSALRWLAVECYRDSQPDAYRETLRTLFLEHREWEAYDELKDACDDEQWQSLYEEFETTLRADDTRRLIAMYVHDGEQQKALDVIEANPTLSLLRRYCDPVAAVDPERYFECYSAQLVPFAAGKTGRSHYRKIISHLETMATIGLEARLEEFVSFLKDEHATRPAFLDELDKAGF